MIKIWPFSTTLFNCHLVLLVRAVLCGPPQSPQLRRHLASCRCTTKGFRGQIWKRQVKIFTRDENQKEETWLKIEGEKHLVLSHRRRSCPCRPPGPWCKLPAGPLGAAQNFSPAKTIRKGNLILFFILEIEEEKVQVVADFTDWKLACILNVYLILILR